MPQVGSRHYEYTPEGYKAAKAEAKRTGKPMKNAKPPAKGGGKKK